MRHRISISLLATGLLVCSPNYSMAADATGPTVASSVATTPRPAPSSEVPELLVQGAGALVGLGLYSWFIAPQAAALGGIAGFLEGRVAAVTLTGAGAVAGTYLYDVATEQPVEFGYFWHRGGFVAGIAAGVIAFGALGYPAGTGSTWTSWAVNRATLVGTGLLGAWAVDRWHGQTASQPEAPSAH